MVEKSLALYRRLRLDVIRDRLREADLDIVADLDDAALTKLRRLVRNMCCRTAPFSTANPTDEAG